MLSIEPVRSVAGATNYFSSDNYYSKDSQEAYLSSYWFGHGAEKLGLLNQHVEPQMFERLLSGQMPSGALLGKQQNGVNKHRPGVDLTVSVPKSVSILCSMSDDQQQRSAIKDAIQRSAQVTFGMIEHDLAETRMTVKGETSYCKTGNLCAAFYLHDLSRAGDPQLHIHMVVMNMTERSDGKWRSLSSQSGNYKENAKTVNGFVEQARRHKRYYGTIFRSHLANLLTELGYTLEVDKRLGTFEIAGFSEKTLDTFSERRNQIEARLKALGQEGAKAASEATLWSREHKKKYDRAMIKEHWAIKAALAQVDPKQEITAIENTRLNPTIPAEKVASLSAMESVSLAIDYLSETHVSLKEMAIVERALRCSLGTTHQLPEILTAIAEHAKQEIIIPLGDTGGEVIYTTKALLDKELHNIEIAQSKVPQSLQFKPKTVQRFLNKSAIPETLHAAINSYLASDNRVTAIVANDRSLTTEFIKNTMKHAEMAGFQVIMLMPSKYGVNQLKMQLNTHDKPWRQWLQTTLDYKYYQSVAGFCNHMERLVQEGTLLTNKKLIVVNDAHRLSVHDLNQLLQIAEMSHSRVNLVGDPNTLLPHLAGNAFQQVITAGGTVVSLQGNTDSTLSQVKSHLKQGQLNDALQILSSEMVEVPKERMIAQIAKQFAALSTEQQTKTQIALPTMALVTAMNAAIRQELKSRLLLSDSTHRVTLLPKSVNSATLRLASTYEPGNRVIFFKDYKSLGIKAHQYYIVTMHAKKTNQVFLVHDGHEIVWDPNKVAGKAKKVQILEEKLIEIAVGDRLVCRYPNRQLGLLSNEPLLVTRVAGEMALRRENGRTIKLSQIPLMAFHCEYAYATAVARLQSNRFTEVIGYLPANSFQSSRRMLYSLANSAGNTVKIVTENTQTLALTLAKNSGNKATAVDTLLNKNLQQRDADKGLDPRLQLTSAVAGAIAAHMQKENKLVNSAEVEAKRAVTYAIDHLSERNAAFSHKEVMQCALTYSLGSVKPQAIRDHILQAEKSGHLVKGLYSRDGTNWTTQKIVDCERRIVDLLNDGRGAVTAIADSDTTRAYILEKGLTTGQGNALQFIMTQQDRFCLIEGLAGTGKTRLLSIAEPLLKQQTILSNLGFELLTLAPTHNAVKELRDYGLNAATIDRFLTDNRDLVKPEILSSSVLRRNLVVIVDENSMSSNKRVSNFMQIITSLEARANFVGDMKQHQPIEHGIPHQLLQSAGIASVVMDEIVRQKNPALLDTVKATYQGRFDQAFSHLKANGCVVELGYDVLLLSIKPDQKLDVAYLERISKSHGNMPILIQSGEQVRIYGSPARSKAWQTTTLSNAAFNTLTFPKPGESPRLLNKADLTTTMQQTITSHDGHYKRYAVASLDEHIENIGQIQTKLANDYLKLSVLERMKTAIVVPGNVRRVAISEEITVGLIKEGVLYGEKQEMTILVARGLTEVERSESFNYKNGDVVRFGFSAPLLGIVKDEYYRVDKVCKNENILEIIDKAGERHFFKPGRERFAQLEIYEAEKREIMAGMLLRFTRSDVTRGIIAAELAQVEKVVHSEVTLSPIALKDGQVQKTGQSYTVSLNNDHYKHWDHAYVLTTYAAQSKSISRVLGMLTPDEKRLANQVTFLVTLTRAINDFTLYTTDSAQLEEKIFNSPPEKQSALMIIGELKPVQRGYFVSENFQVSETFVSAISVNSNKITLNDSEMLGQVLNKPSVVRSERRYFDADVVNQALMQDPETAYLAILGSPKNKFGKEWAYKGGLKVTMKGEHRGFWYNFVEGCGGTPLQAIQQYQGLSFKEAIEFGASIVQIAPNMRSTKAITKFAIKANEPSSKVELTLDEQARIKVARSIWDVTVPLAGTLAERYLTVHRNIASTDRLSFRYLPRGVKILSKNKYGELVRKENFKPALVVPVFDKEGRITLVQRINLRPITGEKDKSTLSGKGKMSHGLTQEFAVVVQRGEIGGRVYTVEGPETGASIASVDARATVVASLGVGRLKNLGKFISQFKPKELILAGDNDGQNAHSRKATQEAEIALKAYFAKENTVVQSIYPAPIATLDKTDWNDVLDHRGAASLQKELQVTVSGDKSFSEYANKYIQQVASAEVIKAVELERIVKNEATPTLDKVGQSPSHLQKTAQVEHEL